MFSAIFYGLGIIGKRPGLVLLYYVLNLLTALLCVAPVYLFLVFNTQDLVMSSLTDVALWGDLLFHQGTAFPPLLVVMVLCGVAYVVLGQFLTMGVFCAVRDTRTPLLSVFLKGIGDWFWPVVRLLLLCSPLFLCCGLLYKVGQKMVSVYVPDPTPLHSGTAALLCVGLGLFVLGRILDYARLHALSRYDRKMSRALLRGILFGLRYSYVVWPMEAFFALLTIGTTLGFRWLADQPEMMGLGFLTAQVQMVWRMLFRVANYGAEWALYDHYQPAAPRMAKSALQRDDAQPPVRRDGNFWEKDTDLEKPLVSESQPQQDDPDVPKSYTLD